MVEVIIDNSQNTTTSTDFIKLNNGVQNVIINVNTLLGNNGLKVVFGCELSNDTINWEKNSYGAYEFNLLTPISNIITNINVTGEVYVRAFAEIYSNDLYSLVLTLKVCI